MQMSLVHCCGQAVIECPVNVEDGVGGEEPLVSDLSFHGFAFCREGGVDEFFQVVKAQLS